MKKQLIEYFVGSIIVMSVVVLIISIKNHDDMTLRTLLTIFGIALVGSVLMTLIRYIFIFRKGNSPHSLKKH